MSSEHSFSPGESPYHCKGGVYAGTQKFFATQVQGGLDALYAEVKDPLLLAFIQQRFLPSSWYDVLPVAQLIRAEARALHQTVPNYLRKRSTFQAQQDIGGVYRFMLKLVSPETVGLRLARMLTQVFDFGTPEAKLVEPGHVAITLRGYPAMLWEWYSTAFEVYSATALTLAGAKNVSVLARLPTAEPSEHGIDQVNFSVECRWDARP